MNLTRSSKKLFKRTSHLCITDRQYEKQARVLLKTVTCCSQVREFGKKKEKMKEHGVWRQLRALCDLASTGT